MSVATVDEAINPVKKLVKGCTVEANFKLFFSEELGSWEDKNVLVTWDETDQGEQVWVGDLEGNLICCARWMSLTDYAKTQAYADHQIAYEAQLKKAGLL